MAMAAGLARRFGRVFGLRGEDGPAVASESAALADVAAASQTSCVLRALVADDSAINCTILKTFLERLGFEVTLAADGLQALDHWAPGRFDLICMDIEMPQMDGLTAFRQMRAEADAAGTPMPLALAVTINALSQEVAGYLQSGFDACLPKPFSRADLVDLLRRRWPAIAD